jgi:hypothetical protein
MLESAARGRGGYADLITAASENAVLRGLFPCLGHKFALAADAFTHDVLVTVIEIRPDWFASNRLEEGFTFEFEGDATAAVAYLVDKVRVRH